MNGVFAVLALVGTYFGVFLWLSKLFPDLEQKIRGGISGGCAWIVFMLVLLGLES